MIEGVERIGGGVLDMDVDMDIDEDVDVGVGVENVGVAIEAEVGGIVLVINCFAVLVVLEDVDLDARFDGTREDVGV